MVFLGSGDYHHLTLALLRGIKVQFNLVVLDWHLDMYPALPGMVSCGSWLRDVLSWSRVKAVYVLGVKPNIPETLPAEAGSKLEVYPYFAFAPAAEALPEKLAGQAVYISLDKDVLASPFAWTNWDQGRLSRYSVLALLASLRQKACVIGVDVCGEICPASVLPGPAEAKRMAANEEINLRLVDLFKGDRQGRQGASA
ncbi:MAG: arginase family protein [Moorellaceae bacterium]